MDVLKAFGKYNSPSKDVAKERLKLILIHDRANIPPQFLNMIKMDLIKILSDYAEIDEEGLEIVMNTNDSGRHNESISSLIASIPIKKVKNIGR